MNKFKLSIGADHAGFAFKEQIKAYLIELGHEVKDHGPKSEARVDYPDYAKLVALDVQQGQCDFGILVCGSGIGMAIAANKIRSVRAASIVDTYSAEMARKHNDLNVLGLGARILDFDKAKEILTVFLNTSFEGGRHTDRLAKIKELEN